MADPTQDYGHESSFGLQGGNKSQEEPMNKRIKYVLFGAAVFFFATFITAYLLDLRQINGEISAAESARTEAWKLSGRKFTIVPGKTERFNSELALEDPTGNQILPLLPCTDDQRRLRVGQTVKFEYSSTSLDSNNPESHNWFCYLK